MAATQPIELKPDVGGPHGPSPPGDSSIQVGCFAPQLNLWTSRREQAMWNRKMCFCEKLVNGLGGC